MGTASTVIGSDVSVVASLIAEWRQATDWHAVVKSEEKTSLELILASASSPDFPGGVLPWPRVGKPTIFYGTAAVPEDWRRLRPLLVAFGGPTVTKFSGRTDIPNPKWGKPEAFMSTKGFSAVARLVPKDDADCKAIVLRGLVDLCKLIIHNPRAHQQPAESTSRLLGRLEGALADGDLTSAMILQQRLRTEDRLDGLNLKFLDIQIAATFRDWRAIVEMPELSDLIASPRPSSVTAAILEAFYVVHVMSADEVGNGQDGLGPVIPYLSDLFASPLPQLGPGGSRLAALFRDRTLTEASENSPAVEVGVNDQATVVPSNDPLALLIEAMQAETLESLSRAVAAVDSLSPQDQDQLLEPQWIRAIYREVLGRIGRLDVPQTWREWLALLPKPEFKTSLAIARQAAGEWSVEEQLGDPGAVIELATLLCESRNELAEQRLAEALPVLVNWFRKDTSFPRPSFTSLYDALWTLLVLGVQHGNAELESTMILFDALLACGLPVDRYRNLLQDALEISGDPGRRSTYWILGLVESTAEHPAADGEARESFWATALSRVDRFRAQLSVIQRAALNRLAAALGLARFEQVDGDESRSIVRGELDGRRVAIYTLTESAGRQAAEELNILAPGLRVTLHSDHVGSQSLKSAAENADLFVVVTWSAKHAATDYIRKHRPSDKPLLYAPGRGVSAIFRVLDEFLNP